MVKKLIILSHFFSVFLLIALPKIFPFTFGDEPLPMGESISVQCGILSGDMPIIFSWFLNGKPINAIDNINIGSFGKKTSVLAIDNVKESHTGNYSCVVQNRAGLSSYSAQLVVKGLSTHV